MLLRNAPEVARMQINTPVTPEAFALLMSIATKDSHRFVVTVQPE